jgi:hypothetical protein
MSYAHNKAMTNFLNREGTGWKGILESQQKQWTEAVANQTSPSEVAEDPVMGCLSRVKYDGGRYQRFSRVSLEKENTTE